MINWVRCNLLNQPAGTYGLGFPGEEYVDPQFLPVSLTGGIRKAHQLLFGSDPDRYFLNYRLQQYMPLLHNGDLDEFLTANDSRITYWPSTRQEFWSGVFGTHVHTTSSGSLGLLNSPVANEIRGLIEQQWQVVVLDASNVQLTKLTLPVMSRVEAYTTSGTWTTSSHILPGSQNAIRFQPSPGRDWLIQILARPQNTLADILANCKAGLEYAHELEIFGDLATEPWKTFYHLWRKHPAGAMQLSGLLLGLAYRIEALREGT